MALLQFHDGKFTILQVSDAQDMQFVRRTMFWMLRRACDRIKPDLVVFTGDNVLGNHLRDSRFRDNVYDAARERKNLETAIRKLMRPFVRRKLPFAVLYGNHDDRNCVTKEEQAEMYRAYPGCIGLEPGEAGLECDTYNVPILSSDGKRTAFNLWLFDTAGYDREADECYEEITPETVDWYRRKSA